MLKLIKIAVTGGLASGKSSVCRILQELGAYVVSADKIVHHLLSPHTELGKQIAELFEQTVAGTGYFDRKLLADCVFRDPVKLQKLEQLLHPAVLREIEKRYEKALTPNPPPLFVVEIPLLFEIAAENWFDYIVVVASPESVRLERFKADGQTEEQFFLRNRRQMPLEEKESRANFVIYNDGTFDLLKKQVKTLFQTLIVK